MDAEQTSHTYRWMTAVICSALVLLIAIGGVFAMRERLLGDAREETRKQTAEREKLASRLSTLESTLASLSSAPQSDGEALTALDGKLTGITERLEALTHRIETLETAPKPEKPEPAPVPEQPAPTAPATDSNAATRLTLAALGGKSYPTELASWAASNPQATAEAEALAVFATGGIPSEAELIRGLIASLGSAPTATKVEDESLVGKINTHLKGLVSVKKSSDADAYAQLRQEALREDLSVLERHVKRLDDHARAPLEDWLKQVADRRRALDALDTITRDGAH